MISLAGQWTRTPSASPLQPKKWNATFWITFNFWWLAGLVIGLKPHPPPLSSQRNEMLIFVLCSTSNDQPGLSMDLNPIHHLSPAKKWNAHILIMFNFWWLAGLVNGLKPHPPLLSSWKHEMLVFVLHSTSDVGQAAQWTHTPSATLFHQKNEMLIFGLHSTSDDWPAGWWTQTPSTTPLQSKNEILIFGLRSTSDNQPGWSMDSNPICHPSPAKKMKCSFLDCVELLIIGQAGRWTQTPSASPLQLIKWNAHFWITFNFWWSAGLVNGIEPHLPALSSQKKWNATFWIMFNFWWSAGLVNGLEPHPPPLSSQKNEILIFWLCSLQMIGWAGQWTWTPSTTLLQPKKWNPHFCITFNFWCWLDWSMDSNPICHPPQPKKWNPHFWITFNFWWLAGLVDGLKPHPPQLFSQKMKSSFLDYVQLLMISQAGQWTQTPSATPLQPKKWNAHFWIMFNFRLLACRSMDSNPICQPSPTNKMKCSFLEYVQLLMISLAGLWTQTPSASPLQPKKWNATFWITFNFWWLAGLVNGLKPHPPPLSSQRNERLIFLLCSTSNDQPGLSMDLNPIHNLSPAKKWNAHILIMFNFWWLAGLVNGLKPHPPPLSSQKKWNACF